MALARGSLWPHDATRPHEVLFCKQQKLGRSACERMDSKIHHWHFTEILVSVVFVLSSPYVLSLKTLHLGLQSLLYLLVG